MKQRIEIIPKLPLQITIWIIKLFMILLFLGFSFFPLSTNIYALLFVHYSSFNIGFQILFMVIVFSFGLITVFGIIKSKIQIRLFGVGFFTLGIIFVSSNPYILSLGIVVSWIFYESWYLVFLYNQLIKDYNTYSDDSLEIQMLNMTFRNQFISFIILAWIVLSISWLSIFISSNYYIELGHQFGTLGISISIAMIIIYYLITKLFIDPSKAEKNYKI